MSALSVASKWRAALLTLCTVLPAFAGDWSPRLAAGYLDSRQEAWSVWKRAAAPGGTCISCHTGVTYLLARPALRRALGEEAPTPYETALLAGIRTRLDPVQPKSMFTRFTKEPLLSQAASIDAILSALFLASEDRSRATSSAEAARAFENMWSLQVREGPTAGSWPWFSLGLSPWEAPESAYYGAALALQAVAAAPAPYRARPDIQEHIQALTGYLWRAYPSQPLHHRLILLWTAQALPGAVPEALRQQTIEETWSKQGGDGAWSIESLGPWSLHARASQSPSGNSYATAIAALTLQKAGVSSAEPRMEKALAWLRSHQDPRTGAWPSGSMNKIYEPDSIPAQFMSDAATACAALALLENAPAGRAPHRRRAAAGNSHHGYQGVTPNLGPRGELATSIATR